MADPDTGAVAFEESAIGPHEAFAPLVDANRFDSIGVLAEATEDTLPFTGLRRRSSRHTMAGRRSGDGVELELGIAEDTRVSTLVVLSGGGS